MLITPTLNYRSTDQQKRWRELHKSSDHELYKRKEILEPNKTVWKSKSGRIVFFSFHRVNSAFRFYSTEVVDIRRKHSSHMGIDFELHDPIALRRDEIQVEIHCRFFNTSVGGM